MFREKTIICALLLNVLFFLLYIAFGQIRHGSLDDYFMSSILTGAYGGDYDVHLYFVNALYGQFLKPFYWLFPKVGWYFIFELLGTFFSFTFFSFFLIKKFGLKYGAATSTILLAALTPDFYFQISFTQCATVYTAAGILSISLSFPLNKRRFLFIGGLFLLAGSLMRFEGFLLGLPFLALLLVTHYHQIKQAPLVTISSIIVIATLIFCARVYDRSLYSIGEYKYYADYQPVRAYFGDGAFYDKESTYDELEERGMSGLDFYLLKAWVFYDTEVFQLDSLKPIQKVAQNNLYKPNPQRMFVAFFLAVSNALMRCNGLCWVLICFLLMFSSSKKANAYPWISMALIAICFGYLLLVNRLIYHVETGVWLYAIISGMPFIQKESLSRNGFLLKRERLFLFTIILLAVLFSYIGITNQVYLKKHFTLIETPEKTKDWQDFLNYTKQHPDDVFLLSFERYKTLGSLNNPAYKSIEPDSWNNIFSWGYWNIHLPSMRKELKKRGVGNPIRDIIHKNVYVIEDKGDPFLYLYYPLHYHSSVSVDTIQSFGELKLFKYRADGDSL